MDILEKWSGYIVEKEWIYWRKGVDILEKRSGYIGEKVWIYCRN